MIKEQSSEQEAWVCFCGVYEYVFRTSAYDIYDMKCWESWIINWALYQFVCGFLAHVPLLTRSWYTHTHTYHGYAYAYLYAVRVLICCAWNGNVRDAISKLTRLIFCGDNHEYIVKKIERVFFHFCGTSWKKKWSGTRFESRRRDQKEK